MAFNGDINFKGISSKAYPLIVVSPPSIIHSEVLTEEYTIPGKNGTLYGVNPYRGSAQIVVTFALVAQPGLVQNVSKYTSAWRLVRQWLQGTGKLIIGDSVDSYYEVQKVSITSDERTVLRYGTLQVTFVIYPFEFLNVGDTGVSGGTIRNNGDIAYPLYKIVGSGSGTLTVNSKAMTYAVSGTLYIDTRRFIAYDASGNNKNSVLAGDYNNLLLQTGNNSVSASIGTLTVYPHYGYNI